MKWRCGRIAAATLVSLTVVGAGVAVVQAVMPPSANPAEFTADVEAYVGGWSSSRMPGRAARDSAWVKAHPAQTVDLGLRACAWLSRQADAPDNDSTGHYNQTHVEWRYLRDAEDLRQPLAPVSHLAVADAAFQHLCPGTLRDKTLPRADVDD